MEQVRKYHDKCGTEIKEGDLIRFEDGRIKKVYLTEDGELGIDATNPDWIRIGRAVECEFGIYPLNEEDERSVTVYNND